jgi:hypothetical protein
MIFRVRKVDISKKHVDCENIVIISAQSLQQLCSAHPHRRLSHSHPATSQRLFALGYITSTYHGDSSDQHLFIVEEGHSEDDDDSCSLSLSSYELLSQATDTGTSTCLTILDESCASLSPWYRIPEISVLHLHPIVKLSHQSSSKTMTSSGSYLREQLVNKYVTWSESQNDYSLIIRGYEGSYWACGVSVDLKLYSSTKISTAGRMIGRMTDQSELLIYPASDDMLLYDNVRLQRNPSSRRSAKFDILTFIDPSLTACLSGAIAALSNQSQTHASRRSYLILGEAGSGAASFVQSILVSHSVVSIHLSPSSFNTNQGVYDPKQRFREAFRCAEIIERHHPCVIFIEDLHAFSSQAADEEEKEMDVSQVKYMYLPSLVTYCQLFYL